MIKILIRISLIFILINTSSFLAFSQGNPLFSNDETSDDTIITIDLDVENDTDTVQSNNHIQIIESKTAPSNILSKFLHSNSEYQKKLRSIISEKSHQLEITNDYWTIVWVLLISFLYGLAHSLGPGHNKIVVFSYFLSERPKIKDGIIMGNLAAFVHALSGMTVAFIILFVVKETTSASFDQSQAMRLSMLFSFGLITIIGLFLLIEHLKTRKETILSPSNNTSQKSIISMALAVGIIPCPGTMILVSFLATLGHVKLSIFAALFMALGMGFTVSSIGIATIFMKQKILGVIKNDQSRMQRIQKRLSIIGSLLIILFGLMFFLGAL
jgi:ABC-type nickel/cobalt efflux system permease component RcnA